VLGDLTAQIKRVSAFYASPVGSVFAQLLATAMQDPVAAERLSEWLRASRQHGIAQLWDRAIARGEVRADLDPEIAMDIVFGPVMWRLTSGRKPFAPNDADKIVDAVLNGLLS
jgi:hypothetical protein